MVNDVGLVGVGDVRKRVGSISSLTPFVVFRGTVEGRGAAAPGSGVSASIPVSVFWLHCLTLGKVVADHLSVTVTRLTLALLTFLGIPVALLTVDNQALVEIISWLTEFVTFTEGALVVGPGEPLVSV